MTPRQRQIDLIARYATLPDAHERLAALVARRPALEPLPPEARTPERQVPGCVSPVWLEGWVERIGPGGLQCRFRLHAESVLVRGLAAALCKLYDRASPADILATEPEFLEALGLATQLSPTRLNGLASLRTAIVRVAASAAS
jgi:cysteine desulfuration protein SufE